MRFKQTRDILNSPWHAGIFDQQTKSLPTSELWDKLIPPGVDDINIWEELYFEEGNLGIYAAWDPQVEFYIITYNLFMDIPEGIETFYGLDAAEKVLDKCKDLGVHIDSRQIWVEPNQ